MGVGDILHPVKELPASAWTRVVQQQPVRSPNEGVISSHTDDTLTEKADMPIEAPPLTGCPTCVYLLFRYDNSEKGSEGHFTNARQNPDGE